MSTIIVEFDKANDRLHIAEQGGWQISPRCDESFIP